MADEDSAPSATQTLVEKIIEPADAADATEKTWWQSKKFFAYIMAELGFFALMGAMIYEQEMDKLGENVAFMVLAVTSGFLAVGYILGQAYIDKYIRVAKITMGRGNGNGNGNAPEGEK